MKTKITILALCTLLMACTQNEKTTVDLQQEYANVLDIQGIPQKQFNLAPFGFSDMGAWHGYALPAQDSTTFYGGFVGPLSMKMWGQWLSKSLYQLHLKENNKAIDWSHAKAKMLYYPGKLVQELTLKNWQIHLSLIFVSERTALLRTQIQNMASKDRALQIAWSGQLFPKGLKIKAQAKGVSIEYENSEEQFVLQADSDVKLSVAKDGQTYSMQVPQELKIKAHQTIAFNCLQSHYFTTQEQENESDKLHLYLSQSDKYFTDNKERWNSYLQNILERKTALLEQSAHKNLAVKCIETLMTNWRSPAGDLKHDGVFPSAAYQGFYGFWSWDSWKQAVALVRFFPRLAKSNIRSMFQYQDSLGMVADCVYFDPSDNNWRDTKAPLASWAVLNVFEATQDTLFVKEMYPKLVKYHNWWYQYRDHDQNGLCEYGSTDGTLIAAKWESGMDNAVRFDDTKLLKNNALSWSMNQESVDLNAYLCAEKKQLSHLAKVLGKAEASEAFQSDYKQLKTQVQNSFWDKATGFFYDRAMQTGDLLKVQQGTEGWTPLYTEIARPEQAKAVMQIMSDPTKFNTKVPLPTLSAAHAKFNPLEGYWRGPVWIDQVYFGIKGLQNYGFQNLSDSLSQHLMYHAEGLLQTAPIRENYHPISGKGLNANHFSWSAAHYLMLLTDTDKE